ncbi:MAG: 16S rRNA (cytosine(1402)-N(4))-methyltransferase RsmH [Paludibacteraceae bacterium]|nr:16S rRNA (cytosine(1402)-N(4))-methyltransferase RsmH [Paludibacteraceae bacterium]
MEAIYHIPAMLKETIEGLAIKPGGVYVDVTFGGGGHSRAILERLDANVQRDDVQCTKESGHLYSFDQDIEAYENVQRDDVQCTKDEGVFVNNPKWTFVHSNFRYLRNWMDYYGVKEIDGLLADLGVSFHHFDCPERGFSFRYSAPLDMRMNQTARRTAADIVNSYSEEELAKLFWLYGEMKNGRAVARAIVKARAQKPILRTEELVEAAMGIKSRITSGKMDEAINGGKNAAEEDKEKNPPILADSRELDIPAQYKKDLARLFQALRIEVNDEMGALREMLVAARDLLKPGGRIAILTYHSLEDRLVKNFLRSGNLEGTIEKDFYGNALTPFDVIEKGRTASDDEVERNPRSRSAKLRVAEKK